MISFEIEFFKILSLFSDFQFDDFSAEEMTNCLANGRVLNVLNGTNSNDKKDEQQNKKDEQLDQQVRINFSNIS